MTVKILAIDDLEERLQLLTEYLSVECFENGVDEEPFVLETATDGPSGIEKVKLFQPELVLLDVHMPDSPFDGFEVCRRIRKLPGYDYGERGVIMFSENRRELWDIKTGYYVGADSYIITPIDEQQLISSAKSILRILRILRQKSNISHALIGEEGMEMIDEHLIINLNRYCVFVDGEERRLTTLEFRLLDYLRRHWGRICHHDEIMDHVWTEDDKFGVSINALNQHITNLRSKIGDEEIGLSRNDPDREEHSPRRWKYIQTIYKVGYMMERVKHV